MPTPMNLGTQDDLSLLIDFASARLARSSHTDPCSGYCAVELANLIAAKRVANVPAAIAPTCEMKVVPFADSHPSISRIIRGFVVGWNDAMNDADRQILLPYAAKILCTKTTAAGEKTRAWLATDWLVRVQTPAWLRLAGLTEHALALESLARIVDAKTARAAQPALGRAQPASAAAWAAASAAASAATRAAASAAAWDAASAAARDALRPTVVTLQLSALALLDSMIVVGAG